MTNELEVCTPVPLSEGAFNDEVKIPYGLTVRHIRLAMQDFIDFLGFINAELNSKNIKRLECMLMQANFSSLTGEFVKANIPLYCTDLIQNNYHNGHPDLIPTGLYPNNSIQHGNKGIEIKGSRYSSGWQGHNPEETWLLVFVYDSNSPEDKENLRPFRFLKVLGAQLTKEDWNYSGRSETSRRTITASVNKYGYQKMEANWIYRAK